MSKKLLVIVIMVLCGFNLMGCKSQEEKEVKEILSQVDLKDEKEVLSESIDNEFTIDKDISQEDIEMKEILSQFDLSDEKEVWSRSIYDEFEIDRVIVIMKKMTIYSELELRHFGLSNGESLKYYWSKPTSDNTPHFRQILVIYLKDQGKDKVVEAIKELEKLDFVKIVEPQYIFEVQYYN